MLGIQGDELGLVLLSLPHVGLLQVEAESEGAGGEQDGAAEGRRQEVVEVDGHLDVFRRRRWEHYILFLK